MWKGRQTFICIALVQLFFISSINAQPYELVTDKYNTEIQVIRDNSTNSIKRMFGINSDIIRYGYSSQNLTMTTVKELGNTILKDYEDILNVSPDDLLPFKLKSGRNGSWYINYYQYYKGTLIWKTSLRFSINKGCSINTIGARIYPEVTMQNVILLSQEESVTKVINNFTRGEEDTISIKSGPFLVVYPSQSEDTTFFYYSYKFILHSTERKSDHLVFLDASSGDILFSMRHSRDGDWTNYGCCKTSVLSTTLFGYTTRLCNPEWR